ncbi:hypothetical protein C1646_756961 [Rhizophagus diaphanus]|nr:hypothetical protein C1646_756961 [Rhizophagus diaphanus] [Rhizophagus sp. MUCL 43196]
MGGWKYSKQRLQKHPFVAKVVRAKKVICICGAAIKLNRKYDEDYINHHANGPECKWHKQKKDVMDDDDIITVDENEDEINQEGNANIEIISLTITNQTSKKRKPCLGLHSDLITKYVDKTPASYGGARRVEVIAKEMYPEKFPHKFTRKKLKPSQKRALNWKIYAESQWRVDKDCNAVRAKECTGYSDSGKTICIECFSLKYNPILAHRLTIPKSASENLKFTLKFYFENNPLKKHLQNQDLWEIWSIIKDNYDTNIWITLADKALKGTFKEKPVFTGLYFTNFLIILGSLSIRALDLFCQNLEGRTIQNIRKLQTNNEDTLTNPNLSFENVAKFKRLVDVLNYQGPIVAMSDNTKLKPALYYNPVLGCIVGLTLSVEQTKINTYEDIQPIINDIKMKKAIAKDVRAYILQILLPNFSPVVIALIANSGTDNMTTITSFHQELLTQIASQLNLPILSIGSDGTIVKFKAQVVIQSYSIDERRNAIMSGACLLTLGSSTTWFEQLLKLSNLSNSVMYRHDVIKLDHQDDGTAYRVFCSGNLQNCHEAHDTEEDMRELFVYLFIMERIKMSMTSFFFLRFWREYVTNMSEKYPNFISVSKNFLADQSFAIFISLAESMACEHFFGMARQINSNFNYSELLQLVLKISQCAKALKTKNITLEKKNQFVMTNITSAIKHSYKLASELAKVLDMTPTSNMNHSLLLPFVMIEDQNLKVSTGIKSTLELENNSNDEIKISDAISQASKYTTERIDDVFDLSNIENINDQIRQAQVISSLDNIRIINNELLTHVTCIESANITQDFPLQQSDYVIVLYGTKICIAKIIAIYYEGYGNHYYSQDAVTQIEDLSYISLQVYLPIHLNIFASQTVEGYMLFTHHCPQNIIYHINSNGVIIGDSSLTLTGISQNKLLSNAKKF